MFPDYIRKVLLQQHVDYVRQRAEHLKKAGELEDYELKDVEMRKAAVFGMRLDSVAKTTDVLNMHATQHPKLTRAFQEHMRNMARLFYKPRPKHLNSDALDHEVLSQFFQSDDPKQNQLYRDLMTGRKLRTNENTTGFSRSTPSAYSN